MRGSLGSILEWAASRINRGIFIEQFSFLGLWYGKRCSNMLSKKMLVVAMIISFVRFIGLIDLAFR